MSPSIWGLLFRIPAFERWTWSNQICRHRQRYEANLGLLLSDQRESLPDGNVDGRQSAVSFTCTKPWNILVIPKLEHHLRQILLMHISSLHLRPVTALHHLTFPVASSSPSMQPPVLVDQQPHPPPAVVRPHLAMVKEARDPPDLVAVVSSASLVQQIGFLPLLVLCSALLVFCFSQCYKNA